MSAAPSVPKVSGADEHIVDGQWNVSEGTIRRWRAEIEKLIKDDSVLLNEWNVSGGRLEWLKAVIAQETQLNEEGEQVTITRKPAVEDTEEARRQFWYRSL